MASFRNAIQFIGKYLLPSLGLLSFLVIGGDVFFFEGEIVVQSIFTIAQTNETALSVVISGLLLFAYLLQFQSQHFQRKIMSRQEVLMSAGFTPILGVTEYKFGHEIEDSTQTAEDKNRLYLDIVNNGNATARDLRVWFGISYNGSSYINPIVKSKEVTLTREKEGSWWPADTGGALSNSSDISTRFVCEPKLNYRCKPWYIPKALNNYEEIPIHKALKKLENKGSNEFRLAIVLRYKTTVGNQEQIPITGFKADPSKIGDDYLLYSTQEHGVEVKDYISQAK